MNLKSVGKIIKSIIDKRNPLLDQRLVHIALSDSGHIQLQATSGSAMILVKTKITPDNKELGYIDVDSLCGMSYGGADWECMSFIKKGIKLSNSATNSFNGGSIYYVPKSDLEGNFYEGLMPSKNGNWTDIYEGPIDFKSIKRLSHSAKSTDVFGYPRMCAVYADKMYTFRHSSMSRIPFHIKKKMYFDYRDIACIQHFLPGDIKIKSDGKALVVCQGDVELYIMARSMPKDYVSSFAKAFSGKVDRVITFSRKEFKESLVSIKKICKTADCKISMSDTTLGIEAIYDLGKTKKSIPSYSSKKINKSITCKTSIDLLLDFARCGASKSIDINISKGSPYNRYLSINDGDIEELIALRNDGKLA